MNPIRSDFPRVELLRAVSRRFVPIPDASSCFEPLPVGSCRFELLRGNLVPHKSIRVAWKRIESVRFDVCRIEQPRAEVQTPTDDDPDADQMRRESYQTNVNNRQTDDIPVIETSVLFQCTLLRCWICPAKHLLEQGSQETV